MTLTRLVAIVVTAGVLSSCSRPANNTSEQPATAVPAGNSPAATAGDDRKYLLERVDDAAIVQLYADGFESLPLREKTLIWHLSQAAIAGRDIFLDQKHRSALEMRAVL